jgi:light-regulated signal transduction histidine kinase (bacteriophytochrome)
MGSLIDNLLKLSRVSRAEMKRQEIDLSTMVDAVVSRFRDTDMSRAVEVSIEPELKTIGDEALVRAVIENLIGNAWKFTSKTEGAKIGFGRAEHNGEPMFFVSDNGAGFDMDYRDKLFGAFQRLHSPVEFEGTGIGLATVQRIVNRHGGKVDAVSSKGNGAIFYFSLESA